MGKSHFIGTFAVVSLLAVGLGSRFSELPDGYRAWIETKLTEVFPEPDRKVRVERRFDAQGAPARTEITDRSVKPAAVDSVEYSPDRLVRTRVVREGDSVVLQEVERFETVDGLVREREATWSDQGMGPLDRRAIARFVDGEIRIEDFSRVNGKWEKTGDRLANSIRPRASPTPPSEIAAGSYADCLNPVGSISAERRAECVRYLTDLPANDQLLRSLGVSGVANLECVDSQSQVVHLANGYRIDTRSCNSREAVDVLKSAAQTVMTDNLACLRRVNPAFARRYVATVQDRRPMLRCAGSDARLDPTTELCGEHGTASCRTTISRSKLKAAAFYSPTRPTDIYLISSDPVKTFPPNDGHGISPDPYAPPRPTQQAVAASLASVVFHETEHAADNQPPRQPVLESAHHDDLPPDFSDAVYGCEALCGGQGTVTPITEESCNACLGAFRTKKSTEPPAPQVVRDSCSSFPPAAVAFKVEQAEYVLDYLDSCVRNRLADACLKLKETSLFRANAHCPAAATEIPARCAEELRARAIALVGEASREKGFDRVLRNQRVAGRVTDNIDGMVVTTSIGIPRGGKLMERVVRNFCEDVRSAGTLTPAALTTLRARYDHAIPNPWTHLRIERTSRSPSMGQEGVDVFPPPVMNPGTYPEDGSQDVGSTIRFCGRFAPNLHVGGQIGTAESLVQTRLIEF